MTTGELKLVIFGKVEQKYILTRFEFQIVYETKENKRKQKEQRKQKVEMEHRCTGSGLVTEKQ